MAQFDRAEKIATTGTKDHPGLGVAKHGNAWYCVDLESMAQVGPPMPSKDQAMSYARHRWETTYT